MKHNVLYFLWAGLFSLCAGLGFIPEASGALQGFLTFLSLLFFLPPVLILYRAQKANHTAPIRLVRNLSALSLLLTLILLIVNLLSAMGSETWGTLVYYILIIVTSPMVCSGYWALSLFLWACLLMASLKLLRKQE